MLFCIALNFIKLFTQSASRCYFNTHTSTCSLQQHSTLQPALPKCNENPISAHTSLHPKSANIHPQTAPSIDVCLFSRHLVSAASGPSATSHMLTNARHSLLSYHSLADDD
uniref:(northern house mosquito) hypothetical protein n=1 Tax=Culex pipiens TaxID=7175 RepID=A0A8D8IMB4_CULPI